MKRIVVEDKYGNKIDITPEPQSQCTRCKEWFPNSEFGRRGKKVCSMCKSAK